MNRKQFLLAIIVFALLMMSALTVSGKPAEVFGIDPDEIDFYPNNPQAGMMVNLNYAPANAGCELAAPSYLKPNIPARLTENVWFGQIIGGNIDYLELHTYFETMLTNTKTDAYRLAPSAGNANGAVLDEGTLVQTGDNYVCIPFKDGVGMFWEVSLNGREGWLMESIRWQNVTTRSVELSSMEAYYLTPHVYEPSEGVMGGTQLQGNDCDGTAPTRLSIGEKAYYMGHIVNNSAYNPAVTEQIYNTIVGYARFNVGNAPQMPFITSFPWEQTSLVNLVDNTEQINELLEEYMNGGNTNQSEEDNEAENEEPQLISENNFLALPIPLGQVMDIVVAGPLCTRRSHWVDRIEVVNGQIVDNGYETHESFVWWQVDTNLLGLDLGSVWIAESITRQAPWGRVDYYLLTPDSFVNNVPNTYDTPLWKPTDIRPALTELGEQSSCVGILSSQLFGGSLAEPNGSALNLRTVPNGDVIGRVEMGEQITVYGESLCWGGFRWWQTSRGGWIAENSHTTALLLPAVQKVAPPIETEMAQTAPISTPVPTEAVATEPAPVVTEEPTRPVITEEPTRPVCDPITGANC
ncbi:MAG: hypothetical protein MUE54_01600 [Anaerolineae bacterium]|jgi:hypothetical protein|nr:hypothetical protein [Anaerolineae bacterium]